MPDFTRMLTPRGALNAARRSVQRPSSFIVDVINRPLVSQNRVIDTAPEEQSRSSAAMQSLAQSQSLQLMLGGYSNPRSGAGYENDKGAWAQYAPTRDLTRELLEVVYVESWAAANFINYPVEDATVRWRAHSNEQHDEEYVLKIMVQEIKHRVRQKIIQAHTLARLMGTSFIIVVTKGETLDQPINLSTMKKDSLANLIVLDKYDASVKTKITDYQNPDFGDIDMYEMALSDDRISVDAARVEVHNSRVLRFDGIKLPSVSRKSVYDNNWGVSELIPVMSEIVRDNQLSAAVSHLVDEASIPVMKITRYRESLAGERDRDRADPFQTLVNALQNKSIFRTLTMDKNDEFVRENYNFAGFPELLDRSAERLAAAAKMPATRFMGQSPKGMNSTGASDMRNYALTIEAMQRKVLDPPLQRLDKILAKDAGLDSDAPPYKWLSIIDLSGVDVADVAFKKVQSIIAAINQGLIDESEGRKVLSGDEIFGQLDDDPAFLRSIRRGPLGSLNLEGQLQPPQRPSPRVIKQPS